MKKALMLFLFSIATLSLAFAGEALSPFPQTGEAIPNLTVVKQQIRDYHDSGRWDREICSLTEMASGLLKGYDCREGKYAVLFDIDETALSNYTFFDRVDFAFDFTMVQWFDWMTQVNPRPIKGTLQLYHKAREKGFTVFFLTGRLEKYRRITEESLRQAGYVHFEKLIMYPGNAGENEKADVFKAGERRKITEGGHTIVLNVGDQDSDLRGGYADYTIKLPNPMYYLP